MLILCEIPVSYIQTLQCNVFTTNFACMKVWIPFVYRHTIWLFAGFFGSLSSPFAQSRGISTTPAIVKPMAQQEVSNISLDIETPEDGTRYQPVVLDFTKFYPDYQSAQSASPGSLSRHCIIKDPKDPAFEQWLRRSHGDMAGLARKGAADIIPVVVHVVYSDAYENISNEQILSQIEILNRDFNKKNPDTTNILAANRLLHGNPNITFKLAKQTPDGKPTNGIDRIPVVGAPFPMDFVNNVLKPATIWDANRYLNIWVMNLGQETLGFAQFPESGQGARQLQGLPSKVGTEKTDGVVINFLAFGDQGTATAPFDKGRSATHEIGHFLGLRHPWGDGRNGCDTTDFCEDTPPIAEPHVGCGHTHTTCNGKMPMTENFMDYTNDECMAMFTLDQVARMTQVLDSSPRRASLARSEVWKESTAPKTSMPRVAAADTLTRCTFAPLSPLPLAVSFEESPYKAPQYYVHNPDKDTTWKRTKGHISINHFQNPRLHSTDWLLLPPIDLSDMSREYALTFDVAYSPYSRRYADTLAVVVTSDCDTEYEAIYYEGGENLATVSARTQQFYPQSAAQWRTESINLKNYIGEKNVQVAFVSISGGGNALFLDNLKVLATPSRLLPLPAQTPTGENATQSNNTDEDEEE